MQDDPVRFWQELTENYRRMSDGELRELSARPEELTEVAQQVLRDEMRLRRLDRSQTPAEGVRTTGAPRKNYDLLAGPLPNSSLVDEDPEDAEETEDEQPATGYTWKTQLCECSNVQQARQISAALLRAGIESWIEAMPSYAIALGNPRVLVAADQLEEARAIAQRPIPQDIIEESQVEVPEYVVPVCPRCGAHDPILESADPVNTWSCEACGAEWSDTEPTSTEEADEGKSSTS